MKACGVVFVLIRLKLMEKTYPGRISVFLAITRKRIFSWETSLNTLISHILSTIGKAYKIPLFKVSTTCIRGELGGRICIRLNSRFLLYQGLRDSSVLQNFIAEKIGNSDGIIEGLADCFWKQASSVRREGLNFRCCERRSFAKERSLLPKELAASDYSYEFTIIIVRMNKFCF